VTREQGRKPGPPSASSAVARRCAPQLRTCRRFRAGTGIPVFVSGEPADGADGVSVRAVVAVCRPGSRKPAIFLQLSPLLLQLRVAAVAARVRRSAGIALGVETGRAICRRFTPTEEPAAESPASKRKRVARRRSRPLRREASAGVGPRPARVRASGAAALGRIIDLR
jgi:hypothetical protein